MKLRQRYVSALIFLATNGPLWYARLGFLSHKDECDWNKAILGDASAGEVTDFGGAVEAKGLFCNEEGRINGSVSGGMDCLVLCPANCRSFPTAWRESTLPGDPYLELSPPHLATLPS